MNLIKFLFLLLIFFTFSFANTINGTTYKINKIQYKINNTIYTQQTSGTAPITIPRATPVYINEVTLENGTILDNFATNNISVTLHQEYLNLSNSQKGVIFNGSKIPATNANAIQALNTTNIKDYVTNDDESNEKLVMDIQYNGYHLTGSDYIFFHERYGNNPFKVQALDINGNPIGDVLIFPATKNTTNGWDPGFEIGGTIGAYQHPWMGVIKASQFGVEAIYGLRQWATGADLKFYAVGTENFTPKDFGDAPTSYPHVSHEISSDLYLGDSLPDAENYQQSSVDSTGDGADDSDGIISTLSPIIIDSTSYTTSVKVFNNSNNNAYLTAWIDFNRNGIFEFNEALNSRNLIVPSSSSSQNIAITWDNFTDSATFGINNAQLGKTTMRIRLSSSRVLRCAPEHYANGTNLNYGGNYFVSPDGEVEDYEITVEANTPTEDCTENPTSIDVQISDDDDDAEEDIHDGDMYRGSSDLEMTDDGNQQIIGLRFRDIGIPKGATITNAYIQFTADETDDENTNLTIHGEKNTNAQKFSNSDYDISSRTKTTASTSWSPAPWNSSNEQGIKQQTTQLKDIIQEIVNQDGWNRNNAMAFIISGTGKRVADSYDGSSSKAPYIHIEFNDCTEYNNSDSTATCYAMTDNNSKVYKVLMSPNANPLPSPITLNIGRTFDGEGSAYRASNHTLYAFDENSYSDLYSINLTTGSTIKVGNNLLNGSVEGAEFYYDPIEAKEILYITSEESNSKLYAFYADTWTPLNGYPKNIYGSTTSIDSLAINPITGVAYASDDYEYDGISPNIHELNLKTGQTTFKIQVQGSIDAEGLAYANDGNLYVEDENYFNDNGRKIYKINLETGELTPSAYLGGSGDVEGISCNGTQIAIEYPIIKLDTNSFVVEGNSSTTNLNFSVTLSKPAIEDIILSYSITDETTIANEDYILESNLTVIIPKDASSAIISIEINGDIDVEDNETLLLELIDATNAVINPSIMVGTIINDDKETNITPIADYRFDECMWDGTAGEVKDSSGNNLHGIAKGDANTVENGKIGHAGYFDGTGDYVEIANDEQLQLNEDASWSLWIKPEDLSKGRQGLLFKHYNNEFELILEPSGSINFYHGDGNYEKIQNKPWNAKVTESQWNHITITRNHNTKTLTWYINGNKIGSTIYLDNPTESTNVLTIGVRNSNKDYAFKGYIDEVKLFNGALSDTQVTSIYTNEVNAKNWDGTVRTAVVCTPPPTLYISNEEIVEGNTTTTNLEFTVVLDEIPNRTVSFDYQVFDGNDSETLRNATTPSDYTIVSGSVVIDSNQTYTIIVPIIGDEVVEDDEKFRVVLTNIQGAVIGNAIAIGTIINDDSAISWGSSTDLDEDNDGILDEIEFGDYPNLVLNPSFESDNCSDASYFQDAFTSVNGTFLGDDYNNNQLTGWNYSSNIDCWVEGTLFALTPYGTQYVDLQGNLLVRGHDNHPLTRVDQNHLTQTITTIPGKTYRFSFWWGEDVGHKINEPIIFTMKVIDVTNNTMLSNETLRETAGGREQFEYAGPNTWYNYEAFFVATSTETKLDFSATPPAGNLSAGADIDMVSVKEVADHDADGVPDFLDLDSDNDGIPDNIEAQTTQGYIVPNNEFDGRGVDTAYPDGLMPIDTDGDSTKDYLDLDSDNDEIFDIEESGLGNNDSNNDGKTDVNVGENGLDNSITHESSDTIDDVNGIAHNGISFLLKDSDNDILVDGSDAAPMGKDFDYRDNHVQVIDLDQDNDGLLDSIEYGTCSTGVETLMSFDDFGTGGRTSNPYTTYCYEDGDGISDCTNYPGNIHTNDGEYTVVQHPNPDASVFSTWSTQGDHTANENGRMMVVNASLEPDEFYRRTYTVIPNAAMSVDLWILNVVKSGSNIILPNISFRLENMSGEQIGEIINTGNIPENGIWNHYTLAINPENNSKVQVVLANNAPGGGGNDLALDDIRIQQIFCDSDNDGIADYLDLDSDNDGIPDNIEAQTTQNYIVPNNEFDNNGVDTAYPNGLTPVDTDEDGIVDYLDLDSDNDNIFDIIESGLGNNDQDNDGRTNYDVGTNGLDNTPAIENTDDYSDVNGKAYEDSIFTLKESDNDTVRDGSNAAPMGIDFDYRDDNNFNNIEVKAEYRFDGCSWNGTIGEVKDSSGNNLHGIAKGDANTNTEGIINRSAQFEKVSSQYVEIAGFDDVFGTSSTAFTVTTWLKATSFSNAKTNHQTRNTFFAKASDSKNDNIEIGVNTNGTIHVYLDTKTKDKYADFGLAGDITTNNWHFVAVTYDKGTVIVQIDSKVYTNNSQWLGATTIDRAIGSPLTIGSSIHIDNYFDGLMDEVKIYSTALSASTLDEIYDNENTGKNWNASDTDDVRTEIECIQSQTVSMENISKAEEDNGTTAFTFTLHLNDITLTDASVNYTSSDGTATAGSDYIAQSGTVTFPAGVQDRNITIYVNGDTLKEGDETFYVTLSNPVNLLIANGVAMATIEDDDSIRFNIERTNSEIVEYTPQELKENLYTQISGRAFNYSLVVYDKNHDSQIIQDSTLKIELVDRNSTVINDVLYTNYIYINENNLENRMDIFNHININRATRSANFRISYLVDENSTIIQGDYATTEAFSAKMVQSYNEPHNYSKSFAIRPANYRIELNDLDEANQTVTYSTNNAQNQNVNLAAEYDYRLRAYAVIDGNGSTTTHYKTLSSQELNVTLDFDETGTTSCADTNTSEITNYDFRNGQLNKNFSHDNVGKYTLHIEDINWTYIDKNETNLGCVLGSSSNIADGTGKFGCNISSDEGDDFTDMKMTFQPYKFNMDDINITNINKNGKNYVYMSDLNLSKAMGVEVQGNIIAEGKEGIQLTNFTKGCVDDEVQLPLNLNFSFLTDSLTFRDGNFTSKSGKVLIPQQIVKINNIENNNTMGISSIDLSQEFLDENNGSMNINILYNMQKLFTEATNPINVDFISLDLNSTKLKAKIRGKNNIPKGVGAINQNKTFYFARISSYLEHYPATNKTSINTPLFVEVYCQTETPTQDWCRDTMKLEDNNIISHGQKTYKGWYLATEHNSSTEGTVLDLNSDNSNINITPNDNMPPFIDGKIEDIKVSTNESISSKIVAKIDIETDTWLSFNRKADINASDINASYSVTMKPIAGMAGINTDSKNAGELGYNLMRNKNGSLNGIVEKNGKMSW